MSKIEIGRELLIGIGLTLVIAVGLYLMNVF